MLGNKITIRDVTAADPAGEDQHRQVERWLVREARLLDERQFMEWLNETAPDIRYWVPRRMSKSGSFTKPIVPVADELSGDEDLALLDEDRMMLMARFMRLSTGMAWAENPPSRTRRVIGNIEVFQTEDENQLIALSNFILHSARWDVDEHTFAGQRRDLLSITRRGLQLQERHVILNNNVLNAPKLSILF